MATNECATKLQYLKHRANDIDITEVYAITKICNINKAAVQWADSVASKGIKHLNFRENMVYGCNQSKDVDADHIPGIINPSDIFTK